MSDQPITNLEDAVRELGALPMPVGPGPLPLTEQQIEALAAAGNRVVNDEMHQRLCMCDAWPESCVSTGDYFMGAWDVSGLETALPAVLGLWESMRGGELGALPVPAGPESLPVAVLLERATTVATHLYEYSAGVGETWDWLAGYAVPELVAEVGRQQARVAELEGLLRDATSYAAGLEGRLGEVERTPFSLDAGPKDLSSETKAIVAAGPLCSCRKFPATHRADLHHENGLVRDIEPVPSEGWASMSHAKCTRCGWVSKGSWLEFEGWIAQSAIAEQHRGRWTGECLPESGGV